MQPYKFILLKHLRNYICSRTAGACTLLTRFWVSTQQSRHPQNFGFPSKRTTPRGRNAPQLRRLKIRYASPIAEISNGSDWWLPRQACGLKEEKPTFRSEALPQAILF